MAFDSISNRVILFAGIGGGDETWAFIGTSWTNLGPGKRPPGLLGHAMTFHADASVGRVVLFGGEFTGLAGYDHDGTWVYDEV